MKLEAWKMKGWELKENEVKFKGESDLDFQGGKSKQCEVLGRNLHQ